MTGFFVVMHFILTVPFIGGDGWFTYRAFDCEHWNDARLHVGGVVLCASGVFFSTILLVFIGYFRC